MTVTRASVFTPVKAELPPNTDLEVVELDLSDNHVAAPEGRKQDGLAAIAAQAREQGIDLNIVVIQGNPGIEAVLRDLATEVGKQTGGTVVVFSDDWVGTYSDAFTRGRLEWAEDKAKYRGPQRTEEAAQTFVDRLEQPETVSWTLITLVAMIALVSAVAGLAVVKMRRAPQPPLPPVESERPRTPVA
ncbi:Rv1476 family membrane protein [Nocardia sp. NPDC055321]